MAQQDPQFFTVTETYPEIDEPLGLGVGYDKWPLAVGDDRGIGFEEYPGVQRGAAKKRKTTIDFKTETSYRWLLNGRELSAALRNCAVVAIATPSRPPGIGNFSSQLSGIVRFASNLDEVNLPMTKNATLSNQRLTILAVGQICFTGRLSNFVPTAVLFVTSPLHAPKSLMPLSTRERARLLTMASRRSVPAGHFDGARRRFAQGFPL